MILIAFIPVESTLSMTAQMLVSKTHPWAGGINPSHAFYLFEHHKNKVRSRWILAPTNLVTMEQAVNATWLPSSKGLEDGILMAILLLMRPPQLLGSATWHFNKPLTEQLDLTMDILARDLDELRTACRAARHDHHITLTILPESTVMNQVGILKQYVMGMDVCYWRYARCMTPSGWHRAITDDSDTDFIDN